MPSKKLKLLPGLDTLPSVRHEWSFEAIGTAWWIGIYEQVSAAHFLALQQAVAARIEAFDKTYSRFRSDSLVSAMASATGRYELPPGDDKLMAFYRRLYDATEGRVTPLIGQLLADAGYDASYSLRPKTLVPPPGWDDVLHHTGDVVVTSRPVLLDFGAAGKGYLVDIIGELLQDNGIEKFCVDAGGDMRCEDLDTPLRVGLENPDDTSEAVGMARLAGGALCGSAGNRRAWAGYHHIMDPVTLQAVRAVKAVWVAAEDAMTADGLATALFFTPAAVLRERFAFEHVMIYQDNTADVSPGFPGALFTR